MSTEFEEALRRQPLRKPPANWRAEILQAALEFVPEPTRGRCKTTWWRQWLWPSPYAWGSLAAIWLVILGLRLSTSLPASNGGRVIFTSSKPGPETLVVLEQQRLLRQEFLDMEPQPVSRTPERDPAVPDAHRGRPAAPCSESVGRPMSTAWLGAGSLHV